ncbi:MAG: hypothetical protein M1839_007027 [Geoglossum umbratile]|nr:MAG: hypothetical protein M1839_007027 [Geoglossum umbratile]
MSEVQIRGSAPNDFVPCKTPNSQPGNMDRLKAIHKWAPSLLSPSPSVIVFSLLICLLVPLLLHFVLYRSSSSTTLPSFLLVGPSGSGKTSLLTRIERGEHATTRTSQSSISVEASLPVSSIASSSYRSLNDPTLQVHKRFLVIDTPGHGKLRHHAVDCITRPRNLKGIIFVVDAANLSSGSGERVGEELRAAAEYLHDVLLLLQKRSASGKAPKEMPVMIAVNKLDLFTALPAPLVKTALESEITKIRNSRAVGLLDSGIGLSDSDGMAVEKEWLGEGGEGRFEFAQMEEANIFVTVEGGNVLGGDDSDIGKWLDWIGRHI